MPGIGQGGIRVEADGEIGLDQRFVVPTHQQQRECQSAMTNRLVGIERNAAPRVVGGARDRDLPLALWAEEDGGGQNGKGHRRLRRGKAGFERAKKSWAQAFSAASTLARCHVPR